MLEILLALLISNPITDNQPEFTGQEVTPTSITQTTIRRRPTNTTTPTPEETTEEIRFTANIPAERPYIGATSALVYDINNNTVIYHQNIDQTVPIASLTKLMTAYIILSENDLNEVVTVAHEASQIQPTKMWLQTNEQITVESLLHALLIQSANDAAVALAIHNAGSTSAFVEKMNQKTHELGLGNTHFNNPAGFDHPQNYSNAHDLLKLALAVYQNPTVTKITRIPTTTVSNTNNTIQHKLTSSNKLLNTAYNVIGLKTGTTPQAGECFIGITEDEKPLLTILLNSPNRFQETKVLIDWGYNHLNNT